jgi:hypothetical protein
MVRPVDTRADSPQVIGVAQLGTVQVLGSRFPQHLNTLGEPQLQGLVQVSELVARELLPDRLDLVRKVLLQTLEDGKENGIQDVDDFVVMFLDGHLQIETHELGEMSRGVAVLGPEH